MDLRNPKDLSLPSSRRAYIQNHPETQMALLHAQDTAIAPTWTKVTVTPFQAKATLTHGYGRRLQKTSISDDAPRTFLNPDRVAQPTGRMNWEQARVTKLMKSDSRDVLPAGESMRNVLNNPPPDQHKRFRSFPHDSFRIKPQMYLEPVITARPGEPVTKNPLTQSTQGYFMTTNACDGKDAERVPLSTWAAQSRRM